MRRLTMIILALLYFTTVTPAQEPAAPQQADNPGEATSKPEERSWQLDRGAKEFSVSFGFSPMQPTFFSGRKEYDTHGRKFMLTSFRFGHVIGTVKNVTYEYLFEVTPLSLAINNEVKNPAFRSTETTPDTPETIRRTTYSIGVQPVGFRFVFTPKRRLKPYVQTSAGFIFSRKPIPVPDGLTYNFSGDFGGGVMYNLTHRRTVTLGYRYFHISNMNIGEINPGYNANMFYVGYSFFSK